MPSPPRSAPALEDGMSPPPAKRKRTKGSVACEACQRRKSRCDLVTAGCCHRCHVLGTTCSFKTELADTEASGSYARSPEQLGAPAPKAVAHDLRHRQASAGPGWSSLPIEPESSQSSSSDRQVCAETARSPGCVCRLKQPFTVASDHLTLNQPQRSGNLGSQADQRREAEVDDIGTHREELSRPSQPQGSVSMQISQVLGLRTPCRFFDPVTHGLVTAVGLQEACKVAKADLASVLATDAILDRPPSEMPSFLRLSIVLYASFHRTITSGTAEDVRFRTRLLQAVRAGLSMSWSSIASTDVAFACLIIGLSPVTSQVDKMCDHPDPLGATTVAYNLISALGLADSVSYLRQVPVGELSAPWLRSHLYNMFMFYSICHQYAWAQAISSKSFGFPDFPECPLSSLLVIDDARTLSTGMLHLVYESRLLELVRTISSAFRKVRTARVADPAQINELLNALSKLQQGISDWRTEVGQEATLGTREFLCLHSWQVELALSLKISTDAGHAAPSPLGFENRFPILSQFGASIYDSARSIALHISNSGLNLAMLPGFSLSMCFLAYATLHQVIALHKSDASRGPVFVGPEELVGFRTALALAHPASRDVLECIEGMGPPSAWGRVSELKSDAIGLRGSSLEGFEVFFDFDLASLGIYAQDNFAPGAHLALPLV